MPASDVEKATQSAVPECVTGSGSDDKQSLLWHSRRAPRSSDHTNMGDYPDALDGQPGFKSFVWLSCCAFPSGPAKSRQPTRQHAQATEGEGEKLRLLLRYLDGSSFRSFLSVFTQVLRKSRRQVTRKMVECFEGSRPSPRYRREGAHASAPSLHCMNLLRTNYSDEMAQFVFDIAGHRNGVGYFLAQQRLVTLTETVERLLYRVLGHAEFGRDLGL